MTDSGLGPPPPERTRALLRRTWRSQGRHGPLRYWTYRVGLPLLAAFLALFALSGSILGWASAFDVMTGLASPNASTQPWVAYPLALAGWLFAPSLAGAVAGYIVTVAMTSRRTRRLEDSFGVGDDT